MTTSSSINMYSGISGVHPVSRGVKIVLGDGSDSPITLLVDCEEDDGGLTRGIATLQREEVSRLHEMLTVWLDRSYNQETRAKFDLLPEIEVEDSRAREAAGLSFIRAQTVAKRTIDNLMTRRISYFFVGQTQE